VCQLVSLFHLSHTSLRRQTARPIVRTVCRSRHVRRRTKDGHLYSPIRVREIDEQSFVVIVRTVGRNREIDAERRWTCDANVDVKKRLIEITWIAYDHAERPCSSTKCRPPYRI
jgi:hypothetical protein